MQKPRDLLAFQKQCDIKDWSLVSLLAWHFGRTFTVFLKKQVVRNTE